MLNKVKSHFEDADKSDNLQEPSVVIKSEILPVAGPCSYTTNLETAPVVPTVNTIYTKEELLTLRSMMMASFGLKQSTHGIMMLQKR